MQPTVLIGLDGATFTVLDPLLAAGHMPNLRAFLAEGVRAELLSTSHPLTPPAFTTMITGRGPGAHGIFDFLRGSVQDGKAFFTLNNFRDIRCETLWTLVSRWGGRVLSLNFPLAAPPPAVAGSVVPGLLSWRHLRRNVYPPELYEEIKALPGFDADEFTCDIELNTSVVQMPFEERVAFIRTHILGADRQWFHILRHLMKTDPADLTAVVFAGVDKIQHICWPYLDPRFRPAQMTDADRLLEELSLEYFRRLDDILGQIFELAGPRANIFLASDHGFGPCHRVFHANAWLEQQGYLRWPPPPPPGSQPSKNTHFVHLNWAETLAYVQSAPTNGVYIRVKKRPDDFGVAPDEYPAFRARLTEQLRQLRDPLTGQPFLKDILPREQAYPGPYVHKAPDLTLVPLDHGFISVLPSEAVITLRPTVVGTHYPEGILLARGPSIAGGQTLPRQSILDVAATLLHSLGLPIPSDYEGKVIEAVFDPAYRASHPVQVGAATEPPAHFAAPQSDSAEDAGRDGAILNRLRALGYVE